jgi:curli biogenesis system outer membrane secretion channel CsgG
MRTLVLLLMAAVCAVPGFGQQKKRIAILNFDYATVQNDIQAIFGTNRDIGKGIADLLVTKLVNSGVYTVVERKAIDQIMAEQNFSNSDRADPNTAAKIGRLLGVDAIVIGSITQFGRDDKTTKVGGSAFGGLAGRYGLGGVGARKAKAVVGLSARMVSTDTAEILAVASGKGESRRSGATLLGAGGSDSGGGTGAYDMTSSNFADTLIGEAVTEAVRGLATQLEADVSRLPQKNVVIDGLVADVSGNTLVLNVGSKAGVKVGDRLKILRVGRTITDPATGRVIRRVEEQLGEVVITDVDEMSAGGKFTGAAAVKVGDHVKNE